MQIIVIVLSVTMVVTLTLVYGLCLTVNKLIDEIEDIKENMYKSKPQTS